MFTIFSHIQGQYFYSYSQYSISIFNINTLLHKFNSSLSRESEGISGTDVCGEVFNNTTRLNIIIWCCPKYPEYLQFFIASQLAVPLWLVAATITQTALSNKDVHVCLWMSGFWLRDILFLYNKFHCQLDIIPQNHLAARY